MSIIFRFWFRLFDFWCVEITSSEHRSCLVTKRLGRVMGGLSYPGMNSRGYTGCSDMRSCVDRTKSNQKSKRKRSEWRISLAHAVHSWSNFCDFWCTKSNKTSNPRSRCNWPKAEETRRQTDVTQRAGNKVKNQRKPNPEPGRRPKNPATGQSQQFKGDNMLVSFKI